MSKRCTHVESNGFHRCGSYAFNLEKDGIEQGDLCDVHYWQDQALIARAKLAEQPAQQEPEWYHFVRRGEDFFVPYEGQAPANATRLYTTPQAQPSREWVGLTENEMSSIVNANTTSDCGYDIWVDGKGVTRAIEAKLKEKNT